MINICTCGKKGFHNLRGVRLCKEHYIEAFEHSADMTHSLRGMLEKPTNYPPVLPKSKRNR